MVICDLDEIQLPGLDELEPPPPYPDDDYDEYDFWYSSSPPILAPANTVAPSAQRAANHHPTTRRGVVANPHARPIFSPRLSYYVPSHERPNASVLFLPPPLPARYYQAERFDDAPDGLPSSTPNLRPRSDSGLTQAQPPFPSYGAVQFGDLDNLTLPPRLPAYSPPEPSTVEDELNHFLERQGYSSFFSSGFISKSPQVSAKVHALWSKLQHVLRVLRFKQPETTTV